MNQEIYPMPMFATLVVSDLEASSRFYQKGLGFKHIFTMPGPDGGPGLIHLRWTKYADLLLTYSRDGQELTEPKGAGIALNFSMFDNFEGNIDAFAMHAREHGAYVTGPINQPWNVREVRVLDPDGYQLVFMAPIDINRSFEDVIESARNE